MQKHTDGSPRDERPAGRMAGAAADRFPGRLLRLAWLPIRHFFTGILGKRHHESEEQLRALFDNMSEGFAVGEPIFNAAGDPADFRFVMVNNAFERQSGLTREVLGKPCATYLPHLERRWVETYCQVAVTGRPIRFEEYNRDTRRHYQVVCYSPAKGRFAILFNDVTDRKRTEESLRQAKESHERSLAQRNAIVNQMTEGLVIFDPQGNLVEMNPAGLAMHGFEDVQSIRKHLEGLKEIFEIFDLEGNPLPVDEWPIGRALRGETFQSRQVQIRRLDTGKTWFGSYGGAPVWDEQGHLLLAIVTVRDVTAQRLAEKALKQSRDELELRVQERTAELQQRANQLARLTSELTLAEQRERRRLAQILHDHLQQLLVGAKFGLHLLMREVPAAQRKAVENVENVLNESIEASRSLTVELSPPILHEAGLAAGLEWLGRWMREKYHLKVDLYVEEALHVGREDVRLLIFQGVRELLFNVTKHAKTDRARVALSRRDDQCFRVVVEDRGAGFDPAALFDAPNLGDGFGLFSLRERLDLLGGRFEVESAPGKGARFTLIAPLQRDPPATAHGPAAPEINATVQETGEARPSQNGRIRLLIVDDHAVVRQGLASMLSSQEDVEVIGDAADGASAISAAREARPDVILMDFSMPEMDGVEATRIIHAELPQVRIIGLSMYQEADRAKAMLDAGASAYLSKSGKSEAILAAIRGADWPADTGDSSQPLTSTDT